jgi:hypothetical protein
MMPDITVALALCGRFVEAVSIVMTYNSVPGTAFVLPKFKINVVVGYLVKLFFVVPLRH